MRLNMFDLIKNIFTCKRSKKGVGKYVIYHFYFYLKTNIIG